MRIGLYDLLPLVIRLKDAQASGGYGRDPILKRVIGTFQAEMDDLVAVIAGMRDLITVQSTTDLILSLLAEYLGVTEFPFSEVTYENREYVAQLVAAHKIKGTLLSLLHEQKSRGMAAGTYIYELWKTEQSPVDEYTVTENPYTTMRSARVVYIEGAAGDEPEPSDGSVPGVFAVDQVPFREANAFRERLNNVFPIHVLVPIPARRSNFEDTVGSVTDTLGGRLYLSFADEFHIDSDNLEVLIQCTAGCQVSCQDRCEALCELTCETTCETLCQATCESECQSTCQSFCQASCESSCQDPCQSFCQVTCEANCESSCQLTCQQACQFACQSADESCQSYCQSHCQSDAQTRCTTACEVLCQSDAQQPCEEGELPAGEGG